MPIEHQRTIFPCCCRQHLYHLWNASPGDRSTLFLGSTFSLPACGQQSHDISIKTYTSTTLPAVGADLPKMSGFYMQYLDGKLDLKPIGTIQTVNGTLQALVSPVLVPDRFLSGGGCADKKSWEA